MKTPIDAETLAEACLAGASQEHEAIARASKADFEAAIYRTAHTWYAVDFDHDSPTGDGDMLPHTIIDLTPHDVLERVLTICRMAKSCGFECLPPVELTTRCL